MSTGDGPARKAATIGIWVLTVLDAAAMGVAGFSKFANPDGWMTMFEGWGYPPQFAFVIGACEMTLAAALLVPRLAAYAAIGLVVIMLGALVTVLAHPGQMGPVPPVAHLVALAVILAARWPVRWRLSGRDDA